MKLKENIKLFKVHDISMIGNPETSHVIGLTKDGRDIIHDITNNNIINNDLLNRNKDLLLSMQKYGYFDINQEQINNIESTKKLVSAYIHVTDRCNLSCIGCYSLVSERNKNCDLSTKEINDIIKKLINEGVKELVISGGEPLLRKDLPEICKEAKKNGIEKLNLISNGTMKFELYENIIPFIDDLAISVDGYNSEVSFIRDKGIMGQVLDTLRKCKNTIDTKFIVTLHKKNIDYVHKYSELSKKLEIPFTFSILTVKTSPLAMPCKEIGVPIVGCFVAGW